VRDGTRALGLWPAADAADRRRHRAHRADHIFLGTIADNNRDMHAKGRAVNILAGRMSAKHACANGHPFDAANTIIRPDGRRRCRACKNARERERYARGT
jgi:hypothetical protein